MTDEKFIAKCRRNPIGDTGDYDEDTLWIINPEGREIYVTGEEVYFEDLKEICEALNNRHKLASLQAENDRLKYELMEAKQCDMISRAFSKGDVEALQSKLDRVTQWCNNNPHDFASPIILDLLK
jgi:hypothetical protein